MTYDNSKLNLVKSRVANGPAWYDYTSADARATVEGAGYFSDGVKFGMRLGDKVVVCYTTGYVTTIHAVSVVSGLACTINPAVLA